MLIPVRMFLVMLAEVCGAVVVAGGGADYGGDVVAGGRVGAAEGDGALMIEFDEDDGAVDAVVKDAVGFGGADPSEGRAVEMGADFGHFHASVAVAHASDVFVDKFGELVALRG